MVPYIRTYILYANMFRYTTYLYLHFLSVQNLKVVPSKNPETYHSRHKLYSTSTYLKDPLVDVYTCLSLVYHDVAWTAISPSSRIGPSVNGKRWPRRCPWCASRTLVAWQLSQLKLLVGEIWWSIKLHPECKRKIISKTMNFWFACFFRGVFERDGRLSTEVKHLFLTSSILCNSRFSFQVWHSLGVNGSETR